MCEYLESIWRETCPPMSMIASFREFSNQRVPRVMVLGTNSTVAPSSDGLSITFAPAQPLVSNATYTVQAQRLRDVAGNLMTQVFQSSFTAGTSHDATPPQITLHWRSN
jgi:hypothetical protein